MDEINIQANPVKVLPIKLVGQDYEITPPKAALAMRMAVESKLFEEDPGKMIDVLNAWVSKAFGPKVAAKVQKRIEDEDDLLDITHIMQLMEKVTEAQLEGDPTT